MYHYWALDHTLVEIRLFELLPGDGQSQVEGRFVRHSLRDASTVYEALSYTWSDASVTSPIKIDDDFELHVPARLEVTLQDLQLPSASRLIWIDAICIDQSSTLEKVHQIGMMREIYALAEKVIVWLDLQLDVGDEGFQRLRSFHEESSVEELLEPPGFWISVNLIVANKYWKRMWVQQELSNASSLSIQCRRDQVPAFALMHYQRLVMAKLEREDTRDIRAFEVATNDPLRRAAQFFPYTNDTPVQRSQGNPFFGTHQYHLIYDALEHCRRFEATDPRDKIFALLGFIAAWEEAPIVVDYELSVLQVYAQLAKHIAGEYYSLAFLCDCIYGDSDPSHQLPTWVPDYSKAPSADLFAYTAESTTVDHRFVTPPRFSMDNRSLFIEGIRVDSVLIPYRQLGFQEILHDLPAQEFFGLFHDLTRTALELRRGAGIPSLSPIGTTDELMFLEQYSILLMTMIGMVLKDPDLQYLLDFNKQIGFFQEMEKQGKRLSLSYSQLLRSQNGFFCNNAAEVEWLILTRLRGRVIYLSQRGVIGLAPAATRPGDEVWSIWGCQWPLILRKVDDHYIVIGPAYHQSLCIHSEILDGEYTGDGRAGTRWENRYGNFLIESIELR